uniref:ResIII domain-containing protein n=1 Tax=Strongyloides papillosus TaxID=174720 RepID=A0A0N5CAE2_STREA
MMKSFGRLFYLVGLQDSINSITSVRYLTTSKFLNKKNTKKSPEIPTPILFDAKLNLFKIGLEAKLLDKFFDINKSTMSDNIEKNSTKKYPVFCNLKAEKVYYHALFGCVIELCDRKLIGLYYQYYHALFGCVIELCDRKLIGLSTSIFPKSKTFALSQNNKQFLSYLIDYNPYKGTILLKLNSSVYEWKELKANSIFDLRPSPKSHFESTLRFLNSGGFTKMPGWKTLESIYKRPMYQKKYLDKDIKLSDEFNEGQQNAIKAALNPERQILCIGGPPGTGKTQVIVEILKQLMEDEKKILVVVPNLNVLANFYERFDFTKYKAYAMVANENAHIDRKAKSHKEFKDLENRSSLISDFREKDVNSESIKDYCDLSVGPSYETKKDNINNSQIIFITAGSSDMGLIKKAGFIPDVVLFEEGNRIMECVSWRFVLSGKRSIVLGDHNQLVKKLHLKPVLKKKPTRRFNCRVFMG